MPLAPRLRFGSTTSTALTASCQDHLNLAHWREWWWKSETRSGVAPLARGFFQPCRIPRYRGLTGISTPAGISYISPQNYRADNGFGAWRLAINNDGAGTARKMACCSAFKIVATSGQVRDQTRPRGIRLMLAPGAGACLPDRSMHAGR